MDNLCALCNNILTVRKIFLNCDKEVAAFRISCPQGNSKGLRLCWCWWKICCLLHTAFLASGLQISICIVDMLLCGRIQFAFCCLNSVKPFPVIAPAQEFVPPSLDILKEEIGRNIGCFKP